eukprot:TRINITY_DN725_c0_g1_i1.p1 TRINITY_DN725_c0_g1~~TRINITY_DN725_c0_g1_i1.p1  ORF type:complete len:252 (+),score=74.34 TRINITY_DN725_c0_g1_i1:145-900(+)
MALCLSGSVSGLVYEAIPLGKATAAPQKASRLNLAVKGPCRSRSLVARAATTVAPKFKTMQPLADRVLVKIQQVEEKTTGGLFLPTTTQSKPNSGEVVNVGEGRSIGDKNIPIALQTGDKVVYSKYAGTEVEFDNADHVLLKEEDVIGLLATDDVKDLKPLSDRVLVKVAEAEEKTAGGVLLTDSAKEKPVFGTIVAVGPGPLGEDGSRRPLDVSVGNVVLYAKYAGTDFKSKNGTQYVVLRASDLMAVLS